MKTVSVIIPAYNEAPRLAAVIATVKHATLVQDILVVDDGSTDDTAEVAASCGIAVCRLPINQGKGTAMRTGAMRARGDALLFLDADLRGLTPQQVDALIRPVVDGAAGMTIGIFRGGRAATDMAQCISPNLSGQRCLSREFFLAAPLIEGSRSGVEIALTVHARASGLTIDVVPLDGATHPMKEEKMGTLHGMLARLRMYADICTTLLRYHLTIRACKKASISTK